jgi:hypothetical protein
MNQKENLPESNDGPSKDFLKRVEFICNVKNKLPRGQRGKLAVGGVHYRRRTLSNGNVQYIVGGLFFPKLLYTMTPKGKRVVHKYKPSPWEDSVEKTFKLAPKLHKRQKAKKPSEPA